MLAVPEHCLARIIFIAGGVCSCIGGRSPDAAAPAQILQNNIPESARFEQAAYKKGAGELHRKRKF